MTDTLRKVNSLILSPSPKKASPLEKAVLERFARHKRAHLFAKEQMFALLEPIKNKRVLEIGCGEGATSINLAYAGAQVVGLDLSQSAISLARERSKLTGVSVDFRVSNIETDEFPQGAYDCVWCDCILHHVVPALDSVVCKAKSLLKPNGLFIAREPFAYARWLKSLRRLVPPPIEATPDEQPFRADELRVIQQHFPNMSSTYWQVFGRVKEITGRMWIKTMAAHLRQLAC